ncbi:MAG: archease [Chloroflexi bacterium]|nr:archease [Chloroflexota bacterium]
MPELKKRFDLIEHTADIGIVAYGRDLRETFANAAYGLFSIIAELDTVGETVSYPVEVAADDIEGLLFEWLNELIYVFDAKQLVLKRFDITELDDHHLKADCYGEKYDPQKHHLKMGVKAATYHMLEVDREKNQAQVIFDV